MSKEANKIIEVMRQISDNIDSSWSEEIKINDKLMYRTYMNGETYFTIEFTIDGKYKYSLHYSYGETSVTEDIRARLSDKQLLKHIIKVYNYIKKELAVELETRKRNEIERLQKELNDKQFELDKLLNGDNNGEEKTSEI